MKLVLIESSGKQETVSKYLGKEYKVIATKGHVRDLPVRTLGVDIEHNFAPDYQEDILRRISEKQPQGGFLYIGKGEHIPAIEKFYYKLDANSGAYMAIGNTSTRTNAGNLSVSDSDDDALPSFIRPKGL